MPSVPGTVFWGNGVKEGRRQKKITQLQMGAGNLQEAVIEKN